jgi:hypothetical protein
LFAPELGIRVTITGQLALLMLIEMMECSGIRVVSANTDGIILLIPEGLEPIATMIVSWWEKRTGLEMEETLYRSVYQRDVNNYVAITTSGKAKRKGVFTQSGVLSGPAGKAPCMDICADAVVEYLQHGTPISDTVRSCQDIRKFIVLRGVKGGGHYVPTNAAGIADDEIDMGKAVRWYYGADRTAYIANKKGDKVAGSTGATPCMKLPTVFPDDIDYLKYINKATEMLAHVGLPVTYWYNSESDSCFTEADPSITHTPCEQLTLTQYKKRKS